SSSGASVSKFIEVAKSKLGCKYVSGGKGPNTFDCSGFVYWCLNQAGVKQSYMTSRAWRTCSKYQKITSSLSSLKKGDVIVFKMSDSKGHVGIALGDGTMIHASSSKTKVVIGSCTSSYWQDTYYCAYRIF
ncbi:MAG: C40 family peptidase, partial [Clostridia bacterium]|nr:C40 family peptidase [Clostridia bacterium]